MSLYGFSKLIMCKDDNKTISLLNNCYERIKDEKKVFLCGDFNFPRGSATGNYIQYLALALLEAEFEVIIVSTIESEFHKKNQFKEQIIYKGLVIHNVQISKKKSVKNFQLNFMIGSLFEKEINKFEINKNDIIIVSSSLKLLHKSIRKIALENGCKSIACVLEWHEKSFFKYGLFDFRYWKYLDTFNNEYRKHTALFPISSYLKNHFDKIGVNSFLLPIMADTREFSTTEKRKNTKKFIFPANGKMKDDLSSMLKVINLLNHKLNKNRNVEFHFCGIKEDIISDYYGMQYNKLKNHRIFVHKWMHYQELIDLYKKMDFLLISRKTRQQTLSNFPSKVPEVMTYGVIPVVSDVGDYTKLYLKDRVNSIQFQENKIDACLEAIEYAISLDATSQSEMSKEAIKIAHERFDYKNWSAAIKNFLKSL